MAMVSNKFLAALSAKLGFHRHVRVGGTLVESQNREYAAEIREAEAESDGSRDYWMATKAPPKAGLSINFILHSLTYVSKCLSDVLEAYLGAVFVDSEFNFKEIERFFETHVRWFFEDMSIYDTFANSHPTVSLLITTIFLLSFYAEARLNETMIARPSFIIASLIVLAAPITESWQTSFLPSLLHQLVLDPPSSPW